METFEGLREFIAARGPALSRAAYLLTGDRAAAAELVQTALVKAAMRWRHVVASGSPEGYVRRIMINEHISWWRRFGRREVLAPQPPERASPDTAEAAVRRLDLAAALACLPRRQRAVIVLRFYEDLSEQATAAAMGCSVGTVKSQTSAALANLRRFLASDVEVHHESVR